MIKPIVGTQLDFTNPINNGLIGCWIFNEGTGTVVNDLSNNGNTGYLTNMASPSIPTSGWNINTQGPTIAFDGIDDHIVINDNYTSNLNVANSITIMANIYITGGDIQKTIVTKWDGYYFEISNSKLNLFLGGTTNAGWHISSSSINLNMWQRVTFVYNGTTVKFYINKIQDFNTFATSGNITKGNLTHIGGGVPQPRSFGGMIDEVRMWNREVTQSEIDTINTEPYGMFLSTCPPIICNLTVI